MFGQGHELSSHLLALALLSRLPWLAFTPRFLAEATQNF
ncbi:hypothetical protein JCM19235_349 [Vibrio maritimus]|uniref:Uncharacterized protein n=1 Tax=Vibrio maritimus TaxID=990268 RepID=A0A090S3K6_9VIBR|nr:hypothetical protein JCM19235_349 [Vibrio maritimus]